MDVEGDLAPQTQSTAMLRFALQHTDAAVLAPRLGQLLLRGRTIPTPSYIATTSRGVVPHLTPDVLQKHTSITAVYFGLEDFIEKSARNAPILKSPAQPFSSILREFVSLPEKCLSILGPRRIPSIISAQQTTNSSIGISTSVGFSNLDIEDYIYATKMVQPDLSVSFADIVTAETVSKKRIGKSADRTHAWLRDTLREMESVDTSDLLVASIPPVDAEQQSFYLSDLEQEYKEQIAGICLYSLTTAAQTRNILHKHPKMSLAELNTPHDVLHAISMGIDLIAVPFVNIASEAGIALSFSFGTTDDISRNESARSALGIDMWSSSDAFDSGPLSHGCGCYTCTRHHRAYIVHLLQAKEMLAWTLLQIHNFYTIHRFFEQIRTSIQNDTFDHDHAIFGSTYETAMPLQTGEGPRVRGYQTKSVGGGEPKKNSKAYGRLEEQARKIEEADTGIASPTADESSAVLEEHGFAQRT